LEKDTSAANQMRQELEEFFQKKGSVKDQLLLQTVLLDTDRGHRFHHERILGRAMALLQQAEAERDTLVLAQVNMTLGLYYFKNLKNYYLAFRHYGRTHELIKNRSEANFPHRDYTIYILSRASYEFFDYENAIRYGQELTRVVPANPTHTHVFAACLVGMAHIRRNEYPQARRYFEWGLKRLPIPEFNNRDWVGILKGNIGTALVGQGKPDEAIPYLEEGMAICSQGRVWDNVAPTGIRLARIYLDKAQPARAGALAGQAHQAARRTQNPKYLTETYRMLSVYHRSVGQAELALRYADSAVVANEAWKREIDVTLKHNAEIALQAERQQAQELRLKLENERQVLIRNGLLLLIALGMGLAYLLYQRQVLAQRYRQHQLETEKQQAETELRHAVAQLEQFTRAVQEKSALLDQFSAPDGLEEFPALATAQYEVLGQLRHSVLLTDESWETFSDLFERVHRGFFHRLKEKYPGLSPAEIRFVALSKLHYSNKEMAAMLGVGTDAIRQHRSRLRRKLHLPDEASLDEVVAGV